MISALLCSLFFCQCKDKFIPEIESRKVNYLVIEGTIIPGLGNTTHIMLSRTLPPDTDEKLIVEAGASVSVEIENGASFAFVEDKPGNYYGKDIVVPAGAKCRLKITTKNQSQYASAFVPVKISPPIDRIDYYIKNKDAQIYVNTHDETNNTRYYRWLYEGTYEYNSQYTAFMKFNPADSTLLPTDVPYQEKKLRCWQKDLNTSILIASTEQLRLDEVFQAPLKVIRDNSIEFAIGYSVHLKQYALTKEAYYYYFNLRKVTEQLGGIFSPLPTEIKGNIFCINNPNEPVIGYVSASTESIKRQYIPRPMDWGYINDCGNPDPDYDHSKLGLARLFALGNFIVYIENNRNKGFGVISKNCVECITRGGTNEKPVYWPR